MVASNATIERISGDFCTSTSIDLGRFTMQMEGLARTEVLFRGHSTLENVRDRLQAGTKFS